MQPLIDADILLYEIGFAAEAGWQQEGVPPFDYAERLLNEKIANICAMVDATQPPILFLTGKTNFRNEIAKTFIYKDRPGHKPFHYYNLRAYIKAVYEYREVEGLEADDLMSLNQSENTIICSRDKDLRIVPGWHYGWEMGNQPQFGPEYVTELGSIYLDDKRKLRGTGTLFFLSQCITGDSTDTIPGLRGTGPVKAFKILDGSQSIQEAFKRVLEAYKGLHGDNAEEYLLEMGRCLWMTRELNLDGTPKLWQFPNVQDAIPDVTITQTPVSELIV